MSKIIVFFIFLFVSFNALKAEQFSGSYIQGCSLDYSLMRFIAKIEKSSKRDVGYPFLISFNSKKDFKFLGSLKNPYIKINQRTIDCLNEKNCTEILLDLKEMGLNNVDLGAFQINYKFHKLEEQKYFNLMDSYQAACNILESLIDTYGYSWETIGKYHSFTKKVNQKYLAKLSKIINQKGE